MIEEAPVLTLRRPTRRPTAKQIAAFQGVPTSFVVDAMRGGGALDAAIAPLGGPSDDLAPVAGPAMTAGNAPGDILGTLAAIHLVSQGDVLVAGFGGYQGCASAGDKVAGMSRNAGAVAFVTDGPVRDFKDVRATGLPVWCTGLTPDTPGETGPGSAGMPVRIGGQVVEPGDMIIADSDGVVVVAFDRIDTVIAHLEVVQSLEGGLDQRLADGFCEPVADLLASDRVVWVED